MFHRSLWVGEIVSAGRFGVLAALAANLGLGFGLGRLALSASSLDTRLPAGDFRLGDASLSLSLLQSMLICDLQCAAASVDQTPNPSPGPPGQSDVTLEVERVHQQTGTAADSCGDRRIVASFRGLDACARQICWQHFRAALDPSLPHPSNPNPTSSSSNASRAFCFTSPAASVFFRSSSVRGSCASAVTTAF